MYDPEDVDSTHLMVRELGPILQDYDIQPLLEDVEDAVYEGVPFELPSDLVDEPGQGSGQGPSAQDPSDLEGQPEGEIEAVEESVQDAVQEKGKAPEVEDLQVGYPFPTPPESSFHALIQAFAMPSFHAEVRKGVTYKLHRSQLQDYPPPKNFKAVQSHRFGPQFLEAIETEYSNQARLKVFREVPEAEAEGRILDLMWVFDYKYSEEGFLERFKARLVVRGDQMWWGHGDTYAATLASKSFRLLLAIIAFFDLEAEQLDVVSAFLHSDLKEKVYARHPPGFYRHGRCLLILRALYGLPQSPRLWYHTFVEMLESLGLKRVPEEPCIMANDWLLVFFFVDDAVMIYRPEDRARAQAFKEALMARFKIKEIGPLKWFLGMRVIRDRSAHKAWLCQDSYIEELVHRYRLLNGVFTTPRAVEDLKPLPEGEEPSEALIKKYQQRVGSLTYLAERTRVDIAETAGKLAQFLTRPSPQHLSTANRALRYAYNTRYLAIEYGGHVSDFIRQVLTLDENPSESASAGGSSQATSRTSLSDLSAYMLNAADASHANNADRRSTQGILMQLFGGPIFWKSVKQATVATSTTEAELLAVASGSKELLAVERLIHQIGLQIPGDATHSITCDNLQTVRLVRDESPKVSTRLRHVDIQQHWLREAYQLKQINAVWVESASMAADGLTKPLPPQRFVQWVQDVLNMKDVSGEVAGLEER